MTCSRAKSNAEIAAIPHDRRCDAAPMSPDDPRYFCSGGLLAHKSTRDSVVYTTTWCPECARRRRGVDRGRQTFDSFDVSDPEARKALVSVRAWADSVIDGETRGLLLMGETGRGKTHLAQAAYDKAKDVRLWNCVFVGARDLAGNFSQAKMLSDNSGETKIAQNALWDCERATVLFLDDLGSARDTPTTLEGFQDLIDQRTQHGDRRATCITTNLSMGSIAARYGERVVSRLTEHMTRVICLGPDYREQRGKEHAGTVAERVREVFREMEED